MKTKIYKYGNERAINRVNNALMLLIVRLIAIKEINRNAALRLLIMELTAVEDCKAGVMPSPSPTLSDWFVSSPGPPDGVHVTPGSSSTLTAGLPFYTSNTTAFHV